jgi:hypothetical protein
LEPIGGYAGVFDERAIFLEWNHMQGLVILLPKGNFFLKVSTLWLESDEETVERIEDLPVRAADMFQGFWERRGVKFKE